MHERLCGAIVLRHKLDTHELECFRLNISIFFTNPMKSSHEHIVKIAQNTGQAKSGLKLSVAVI